MFHLADGSFKMSEKLRDSYTALCGYSSGCSALRPMGRALRCLVAPRLVHSGTVMVVRLYLRSIQTAFRRSSDPDLGFVWKFAFASIACIVFALISIVDAFSDRDDVVSGLVAATVCLGIAAATGAYVIYAVRPAPVPGDDDALPPN